MNTEMTKTTPTFSRALILRLSYHHGVPVIMSAVLAAATIA